jgi:hypothetical protein
MATVSSPTHGNEDHQSLTVLLCVKKRWRQYDHFCNCRCKSAINTGNSRTRRINTNWLVKFQYCICLYNITYVSEEHITSTFRVEGYDSRLGNVHPNWRLVVFVHERRIWPFVLQSPTDLSTDSVSEHRDVVTLSLCSLSVCGSILGPEAGYLDGGLISLFRNQLHIELQKIIAVFFYEDALLILSSPVFHTWGKSYYVVGHYGWTLRAYSSSGIRYLTPKYQINPTDIRVWIVLWIWISCQN